MYGYGMMPQYGGFQQPGFAASGQFFPGMNNQTMGQPMMGQVIRPTTTSVMGGATTTATAKTTHAQVPGWRSPRCGSSS